MSSPIAEIDGNESQHFELLKLPDRVLRSVLHKCTRENSSVHPSGLARELPTSLADALSSLGPTSLARLLACALDLSIDLSPEKPMVYRLAYLAVTRPEAWAQSMDNPGLSFKFCGNPVFLVDIFGPAAPRVLSKVRILIVKDSSSVFASDESAPGSSPQALSPKSGLTSPSSRSNGAHSPSFSEASAASAPPAPHGTVFGIRPTGVLCSMAWRHERGNIDAISLLVARHTTAPTQVGRSYSLGYRSLSTFFLPQIQPTAIEGSFATTLPPSCIFLPVMDLLDLSALAPTIDRPGGMTEVFTCVRAGPQAYQAPRLAAARLNLWVEATEFLEAVIDLGQAKECALHLTEPSFGWPARRLVIKMPVLNSLELLCRDRKIVLDGPAIKRSLLSPTFAFELLREELGLGGQTVAKASSKGAASKGGAKPPKPTTPGSKEGGGGASVALSVAASVDRAEGGEGLVSGAATTEGASTPSAPSDLVVSPKGVIPDDVRQQILAKSLTLLVGGNGGEMGPAGATPAVQGASVPVVKGRKCPQPPVGGQDFVQNPSWDQEGGALGGGRALGSGDGEAPSELLARLGFDKPPSGHLPPALPPPSGHQPPSHPASGANLRAAAHQGGLPAAPPQAPTGQKPKSSAMSPPPTGQLPPPLLPRMDSGGFSQQLDSLMLSGLASPSPQGPAQSKGFFNPPIGTIGSTSLYQGHRSFSPTPPPAALQGNSLLSAYQMGVGQPPMGSVGSISVGTGAPQSASSQGLKPTKSLGTPGSAPPSLPPAPFASPQLPMGAVGSVSLRDYQSLQGPGQMGNGSVMGGGAGLARQGSLPLGTVGSVSLNPAVNSMLGGYFGTGVFPSLAPPPASTVNLNANLLAQLGTNLTGLGTGALGGHPGLGSFNFLGLQALQQAQMQQAQAQAQSQAFSAGGPFDGALSASLAAAGLDPASLLALSDIWGTGLDGPPLEASAPLPERFAGFNNFG